MERKVSKLHAIILILLALLGGAYLWFFFDQSKTSISLNELKEIGYFNLNSHSKIDYNKNDYTVLLNDKSLVEDFDIAAYNSSPTLYKVQTTLIPNKDKALNQMNWKLPELQENNLNYLHFISDQKLSSFYIPAIKDYDAISKGYALVMLYIDSLDFFSDSSGIYIPGQNKDLTNIKKGNYGMRGKEWERPVYIQLFDKSGFLVDQGWMGTRIHGNLSRAAPQKSLRFYPRSSYNKEQVNSLFTHKPSEKRFILRTPLSSNWGLVYKDALISKIAIDLGMDAMPSVPVITYLNGEYWGYTNYRERIDEHFFFENYNIDTLDFVEPYIVAKYGSADDYKKMDWWIMKNDLRIDTNYNLLLTKIDIDNYMRYFLLEFFFANKDWPHNNVRAWKSSELDNKWRWLVFDMDATGKDSVDMAEHFIYQSKGDVNFWGRNMQFGLLANEAFYAQLLEKYDALKEEQLNLDYLLAKTDSMKELYMPLLPDQIKRWGFPRSIEDFEEDHENFKSFLLYREDVILDELARVHEAAIDFQDAIFKK